MAYRHPHRGRLYAGAALACVVGAASWAGCVVADVAHGADRPLWASAWGCGALLPLLLHRAGARTVLDAHGLWTRGGLLPRGRRVAWPQVHDITVELTHRLDGAVYRIVVVRADRRHVPLAVPQTRAWRRDGAAVLNAEYTRVRAYWQATAPVPHSTARSTRVTKPSTPR
ncbi:hypothetical protein JJV70_04775 [Streptomyces sp. JJ66]|uniref:hypothetical protein n=1 Tax=Streptomyces sp. JJ66 TaxID=2803843 RepID=UPI001C57948F|nr:hypothetical protein [Streptomyces sp. JJ66]MBW1601431.1 hypothetical protein [Streptomyces sp. JJ66]